MREHEYWMEYALKEAQKAFELGEVPVGAVVVYKGQIIAKGYNQVESLRDATAHAEMIALSAAYNYFQSWRLNGCTLYVTLEPCPMCAGAIVLSRIDKVVFGAYDFKAGACGSVYNITGDGNLNHKVEVIGGIMADESQSLLRVFFQELRKNELGRF
ncbi:MAG: tRNA adenosine(34) deaminase TadA [Candidatus Kryptonium sp.]|nr:tRNA adenosine(34) deaminase TadA [Candidatus Kryptonium sp.]MCX7762636.1 tRNA adenosine(34) deaminase TadA [Candidatus Kryptonium sp.]MDW8108121.1 tRNA adenosine(34) deaminase TadA [Candidatus Kryptonium sp.]